MLQRERNKAIEITQDPNMTLKASFISKYTERIVKAN